MSHGQISIECRDLLTLLGHCESAAAQRRFRNEADQDQGRLNVRTLIPAGIPVVSCPPHVRPGAKPGNAR